MLILAEKVSGYKMFDYHMHTTHSDGKNSIEEMVELSKKLNLKEIAITDHIWKTTEWFDEYKENIQKLKSKNLSILVGFEAKALSINGEIDATQYMCDNSEIRLGAIHRIPSGEVINRYLLREEICKNKEKAYFNWFQTTKNMIKNKNVDIIAHPLMALDKYKIEIKNDDVLELLLLAKEYNKKLEISSRYKKSNEMILNQLYKKPSLYNVISYGSDAHSVKELEKAHT